MTIDELKARIKAIDADTNRKKCDLYKRFAISHSPYNIGDVIRDDMGTRIKIDRVNVIIISDGTPSCFYIGPRLTAQGVPFKSGARGEIWQGNAVGCGQ